MFAACLCLSASACVTATFVVQQYDGPALPEERIAILRLVGGDQTYLATLDGETLGYRVAERTDRVHIELLPGPHEVGISLHERGRIDYRVFDAKPGATYRIVVKRDRLQRGPRALENWHAGVFEIDPKSEEPTIDVSRAPLPLAPPAAASPTAPPSSVAPSSVAPPITPLPSETPSASEAPAASSSEPHTPPAPETEAETDTPTPEGQPEVSPPGDGAPTTNGEAPAPAPH